MKTIIQIIPPNPLPGKLGYPKHRRAIKHGVPSRHEVKMSKFVSYLYDKYGVHSIALVKTKAKRIEARDKARSFAGFETLNP